MNKQIIFENKDGEVIRSMPVGHRDLYLVQRKDTQRIDLIDDVEKLTFKKIPFRILKELSASELVNPIKINSLVTAKLVSNVISLKANHDEDLSEENKKIKYASLLLMLFLFLISFKTLMQPAEVSEQMKEKLKEHVAKIIKNQPKEKVEIKKIAQVQKVEELPANNPVKAKVSKSQTVSRMGALSVLGSLSKGTQKGGLNLGAVKTSPGIGLGGTQGSGGMQTSLYAKGLVAAPLGQGGNIQGGGGYGTKGKGGGQAGYGNLSLIGSAGTGKFGMDSSIPLGREAIIEGGLDKELIADIVRQNMGQIRFCYEQGLQTQPTLNGRVMASWTIGADGHVTIAGIKNTSLHSQTVEDCIVRRIKTWKFPIPQGGQAVPVAFPFLLQRQGQG